MGSQLQQMLQKSTLGGDSKSGRRGDRQRSVERTQRVDPNRINDDDDTGELSDDVDERDDLDTALDSGDNGDGDGDDTWTPPTRDEVEALQAKLRRARQQAKKLRQRVSARDDVDDLDDLDDLDADDQASEGTRQSRARAERKAREREREITRWQERAVRGSARAALLDRGADPDLIDLALGKLKASEIEFDDEDEPDLDDWLDDMEERYPRLFAPATPPRAARASGQSPAGRWQASGSRIDQGAGTSGAAPRRQPSMMDQITGAFAAGNRRSPMRPGRGSR